MFAVSSCSLLGSFRWSGSEVSPVHAGELVILIDFKFESKLHNPLHLLKFVVVGPGR